MAGPPSDAQQTLYNILNAIGQRMLDTVAPKVLEVSQALAAALIYQVDITEEMTYVEVPHYWALYVHENRGPSYPKRERSDGQRIQFLVWFENPADDPRLAAGYPIRESDIRHLTREDFAKGLEINTERFKAGASPYMYVARFKQPSPGTFFFTRPLAPIVEVEVPEIIDAEMQKYFDTLVINKRDRARFRLR